ncbi:MAG: dihydroxyhexaprenylbenzoate methyltransferase [uncultured bacterium]|nr:MAG: dihydroxyhexaprenylbenzoate methyltransferase [uncultured bacterium]
MESIITADLVKHNHEDLKKMWMMLLKKYYQDPETLKSEYMHDVNCHHCGSTQSHSKFKINGFNHVTCASCGTVYVTPRLQDKYLSELYDGEYYSYFFKKSLIPAFEVRKKLIGERKANQILQFYPKKGRILDIGSGIGEVIDVFQDRGWLCQAIEVNPIAVKWLENKNIKVFADIFEKYSINEKFDVIMGWGVVEHVSDPIKFLEKVYSQLKPGGVFVSEVPNGDSLLVDYCRQTNKDPGRIIMGEQHIILYSVKAYEQLHQTCGFQKLHVQTNGLDVETIFKINNVFVSDSLIIELQKTIDSYFKGDLLRGFWKKPFEK